MKDSKPAGTRDEQEPKKWVDKTWVQLVGVTGAVILFVLVAGLILDWYVDPNPENSKAKRDLVQALALLTAGVAGAFGIYFTWRGQRITREGQEKTQQNTQEQLQLTRENLESTQKDTAQQLHLTQQGQITERFTQAIEQLGATDDTGKKLEIRLGGIYALERIARDSPERDYSTVMEVLAAYVRENTPQAPRPSKGPSDGASTSNESTAGADEGAKQPAPPEPRRPAADIEAILDVLKRAQARVPKKHRTRLDLREANLYGANLREANLQSANCYGAILREANLYGTNLRKANLQIAIIPEADLQTANLREARLVGAYLYRANLYKANLREANLQSAILQSANLQSANLQSANLYGTNLYEAYLQGANLREANLTYASLQRADLSGANLQGAKVTPEQLAEARSLQGATMPDGSKHP